MKKCTACLAEFRTDTWTCPSCGAAPVFRLSHFAFIEKEEQRKGFSSDSHDRLSLIEENSFWFRARNRLILDLLHRYCSGFGSLIDVGCGTGLLLQKIQSEFPDARLVGAEALEPGLAHAAQRLKKVDLIQADAARLPYVEEFDVAGAFDVLEHIDDDCAALREIARVLRPRGWLLLTVPQHPWLWSAADTIAFHRRRYRWGELEAKVEAAGLRIVMTSSFLFFLLPALIFVRMSKSRAPEREHELSRTLNHLLEKILDAERRLIGWGARWPIGSTRVIVAQQP